MAPTISVIIPTTGRDSVLESLRSVRSQDLTRGEVETVVVVDSDSVPPAVEEAGAAGLVDQVIMTGGRRGAAVARNLGTSASRGAWVAYLDDDDCWDPRKLSLQLAAGRPLLESGQCPVLSCKSTLLRENGTSGRGIPARTCPSSTRVEDYLFRRRRLSVVRASIPTSTLMAPRDLAIQVGWDEGLPRHQDWDWLIRATHEHGGRLEQLGESLVRRSMGSAGSISSTSDWASSLSWALDRGGDWNAATLADFLVAQPLRYALQARSLTGVRRTLAAVRAAGHAPSVSATSYGLSGLFRRGFTESVAQWLAK